MKNSAVQQFNVTSARQNLVLLLKTRDATIS